MSAYIEGKLDLDDDDVDDSSVDDDDDDDEDDNNDNNNDDVVLIASSNVVGDSESDDEELEVFGGNSHPRKHESIVNTLLSEPQPSQTTTISSAELESNAPVSSSLLDAMSAAVTALEKGFALPVGSSSVPIKQSNPQVAQTIADNPGERDAFGIAYQPFKKTKGYEMPKAPVLEDEFEFDQTFQASALLQGSSAGDDEFEFDADAPQDASDLVDAAIARVAQMAIKESDDFDTQAEVTPEASGTSQDPNPDSLGDKFDVRRAARDAFKEISNIYGSGLGDIEVRMLDADADSHAKKPDTLIGKPSLGVTETIEECDEDELEREEQEEEARVQSETTLQMTREAELASEFDALVNESAVHTTESAAVEERVSISYSSALKELRARDFSEFESIITVRTYDESTGLFSSLTRPVDLNFEGSERELRWPFLLAQVNYDPSIGLFRNMLQSIYFALLPEETRCPTVGLHWDAIGFQGNDPCTDVNRSMKMLAILQVLHLVDNQPELGRKLHALSRFANTFDPATIAQGRKAAVEAAARSRGRNGQRELDLTWPFMCVSINFTRETIQVVRSGALNKKMDKRRDILSVLHDFHHACFLDFAKRLVSDSSKHHAFHLAELSKSIASNPLAILKTYSRDKKVGFPFSLTYSEVAVKGSAARAGPSEAAIGGQSVPGKFDTLEEIEKKLDTEPSQSTAKSSFWTSIVGGGKASKFKASS